jgi:hypothetical protein
MLVFIKVVCFLIDPSKDVGLQVNTEKNKYILSSRHQNAGHSNDTKINNRCFENVAQFRYLGTTIINQNLNEEEIKRRLTRVMPATVQVYLDNFLVLIT